ncbi:MAG: hypothetical protein HKP10_07720 [Kiritimatiellales bacterium]|nr:hypothetical protein [Pontiella sp.]NNJ71157.1 hypothetical protein [Kiritimatiellales bacterium]
MGILTVTFNGKTGDSAVAAAWIGALNDARIIQEKAGYLFKASFDGSHLMLAVNPCLIHGERSRHYNQHLDKEDALTLIGTIDAQGIFTILFHPESREQVAERATEYIERYRRFAAFLFDNGYKGCGPLDEVTQAVLQNLGLDPAPQTLAAL